MRAFVYSIRYVILMTIDIYERNYYDIYEQQVERIYLSIFDIYYDLIVKL